MRQERRVLALIITYEAPAELASSLPRVADQVERVVVVDDGSQFRRISDLGVAEIHHLPANGGIAAALNYGMRRCAALGATHVLTLDQDTRIPQGYVSNLLTFWDQATSAGLEPAVMGARWFGVHTYPGHKIGSLIKVDEVVQSGTLFCLNDLRMIGFFDESLVIDGVDADVCLKISASGKSVLAAPLAIDHPIGETRHMKLCGHTVASTNHPPFRRYYIVRNRLRLVGRHGGRKPRWAALTLRRLLIGTLLSITVETRRRENALAAMRGARDALLGRTGSLDPRVRREWGQNTLGRVR